MSAPRRRRPAPPPIDPEAARGLLRRTMNAVHPLPEAFWADGGEAWQVRRVARGERLTHEGAVEDRFGVVLDGVQRAYVTTPAGDEHTVAFLYPPNFAGVPDSFLLRTPSACTVEALSEGAVLTIGAADFAALLDTHRELERWLWTLLARALAGRGQRERDARTLPAEARYARLLRESPQVVRLAPLRHVASYLGMTPETLSRVRAALS